MLKKLSIQAKLLSALGLIVLINVLSGGFIINAVMKADKSVKFVDEVAETSSFFGELEFAANHTHAYMVRFLNSGELAERDRYLKSAKETMALYEKADENISDGIAIRKDVANSKELFMQWKNDIAQQQINYMRSPSTVDMARLLEASFENEQLWESLDKEFLTISNTLDALANERSDDLNTIMDTTMVASFITLFMTLVAIGAAGFIIVFLVSKPLRSLVDSTNALVNKEWDTNIGGTDRQDEIGQMANALLQFRDNGVENEKLMAEQKLVDEQKLSRAKMIEELIDGFREESTSVATALLEATSKMQASSVTMQEIANDTSKLSQDTALSAENAGNNVNNVSAATEQLTASIQEISVQLSSTNKLALESKETSTETVEKMRVLESSANEINNIIEIISDIAEQTNLLALNATIEAARAGEAGKGFAVVASEVKNLASETAKATEKVQEQVNRIQGDTSDAVSYIENISKSIEKLTESMTAISAAMEEQTSATQEISRNVSEASQGTNLVVQNIGSVSDATRKTQDTSEDVNKVSKELATRSDTLKESINNFLSKIQAA